MRERGAVTFGRTRIGYEVVRSQRRKKTVEITLDAGAIVVAAPLDASAARIEAVVRKRAPWIIRNRRPTPRVDAEKRFISGETLPYMGRQVRMFVRRARVASVAVRFDHWSFHVSVPRQLDGDDRAEAIRRAFRRWYRQRAEDALPARIGRWSKRAGVTPAGILVRDQRQRWASCSSDGVLRFNWRVMMLEPALIDYVIVHELSHLQHRTHSRAYWREVARVLPGDQLLRARLRATAAQLPL